jgi:hypothetical protein
MTVNVPSQYVGLLKTAASKTGIPYAVVAAQIYTESGFNPLALSPTGARGIAQFEPGTFASYGTGSPDNAADAMAAYADYMSVLLKQEGGNLRNALAAYNAGPGDLPAGMGYANGILNLAGTGNTTVSGGGSSSSGSSSPSLATDILDWITDPVKSTIDVATTVGDSLAAVGKEFESMAKLFDALTNPDTYIRIGAAIAGCVLFMAGLIILFRVDRGVSKAISRGASAAKTARPLAEAAGAALLA